MTTNMILEFIVLSGLVGLAVMLISVLLSCVICGAAWVICNINNKIRGRDA